jgi:hypothetical protein
MTPTLALAYTTQRRCGSRPIAQKTAPSKRAQHCTWKRWKVICTLYLFRVSPQLYLARQCLLDAESRMFINDLEIFTHQIHGDSILQNCIGKKFFSVSKNAILRIAQALTIWHSRFTSASVSSWLRQTANSDMSSWKLAWMHHHNLWIYHFWRQVNKIAKWHGPSAILAFNS